MFSENISFFVGDGSRIQLWSDIWIGTASLRSCYPRIYALSSKKAGIIADFGEFTNGLWNWKIPLRRALFDWELEVWDLFIDTINCGKVRLGIQDSVRWNFDSNGSLNVKSLLNLIGPPLGTKDVVWKYCLSKLTPPNVEFFVWKAAHGRLDTKVELLKRNFNIPDFVLCPLCSIEQESISHLLCHCQVSWSIWQRWCNVWHVSFIVPASFREFFYLMGWLSSSIAGLKGLGACLCKAKWPSSALLISELSVNPELFALVRISPSISSKPTWLPPHSGSL
ncbi:hypothetical protein GQ457_12G026120 [Hibiscus cannabinus]